MHLTTFLVSNYILICVRVSTNNSQKYKHLRKKNWGYKIFLLQKLTLGFETCKEISPVLHGLYGPKPWNPATFLMNRPPDKARTAKPGNQIHRTPIATCVVVKSYQSSIHVSKFICHQHRLDPLQGKKISKFPLNLFKLRDMVFCYQNCSALL